MITTSRQPIIPINIYQFWDSEKPPEEVSILLETWKSEPGFQYHLHNYDSARSFIKQNFEISTLASFDSCAVPAMQADLFRYCVLFQMSGIYVDADTRLLKNIQNLVGIACPRGILMNRSGRIANDFMFFSQKQDPLLERVIRNAESNINLKISQNVWEITGPGIMTKLFTSDLKTKLFSEISILTASEIKEYIGFQWKMNYKKSEKDWRNFSSSGASIFKPNKN
jgi:mannosyltransferase OCH1-like enzyme